MWTVENDVGIFRIRLWIQSYPQKRPLSGKVMQKAYPQVLLSVYRDLEDLLGFPRPYYYY